MINSLVANSPDPDMAHSKRGVFYTQTAKGRSVKSVLLCDMCTWTWHLVNNMLKAVLYLGL